MATNPAATQLYPLSTQEGEAIPLDVIFPVALVTKSFAAAGVTNWTPPPTWAICSFYCAVGCILQYGATVPNPLLDGVVYDKTALIVPDTVMVLSVDSTVPWRIIPTSAGAGTLYIQAIQKWAALALTRQITKK